MGNQKQKWTVEEEALLNGVAKHGPGKWKNILKDPDFAPFLTQRSNIDLKPSRGPKVKTMAVTPPSSAQNSAPTDGSADALMDDLSNNAVDGKSAPRLSNLFFLVSLISSNLYGT
ncbi:hypothetical protein GH714_006801 [Hevea brasiliensis]|uniref:MYB transcription factor n=1 Tax=Hevea brasiliensis TaxID=3981 RepID=A0A6A6N7G0_HEVBR|nr:hypothetical protein GH714_006801 [Hevea brasiliensis]